MLTMSEQWSWLLIVFIIPEFVATVNLYGVDVDRIVEQYEHPDNRLKTKQSNLNLNNQLKELLNYNANEEIDDRDDDVSSEYDPSKPQSNINQYIIDARHLNKIAGKNKEHIEGKKRHEYINYIQNLIHGLRPSNEPSILDQSYDPDINNAKIYVIHFGNEREHLPKLQNRRPILNKYHQHPIGHTHRNKENYKGFRVHGLQRRAGRESKEDSMEADYKPVKRPRDHFTGRTAIPYVKNRGDIYERDDKFK